MSATQAPARLSSRNWFGKASAGLIAGFAASLAITCIYSLLAGVRNAFLDAHGQLAMWAIAPLWAGILSFCFLFRSGWRAWVWLGAVNVAAWGLLFLLRFFLRG